jgi:hypothetical protein
MAEFQQAVNTRGDAVDWVTIGGRVMLAPVDSAATFQGNVPYPAFAALPSARKRILIREYEIYGTDNQSGVMVGTGAVHAGDTTQAPYAQRVVYADAVEIVR